MTAIIIPAHNESNVIERSLVAIVAQAAEGDEIIVVCNGCTDDTAAVARRFAPRVTVLTTPRPSKSGALNLGDQHACSFPRVYLDADVILAEGALTRVCEALAAGQLLAVSPAPKMDFGGCGWAVRAYYDVWLSLPYCRSGMIGAGVYALSEAGRARFAFFPDLIADDGYVRALFQEHERGRVPGALSIVRAPAGLQWLIRIKTRSRLGGLELQRKFPGLLANEVKDYAGAMSGMIRQPHDWPKVFVYLYVNLMARLLAKRQFARLDAYHWEKDWSSRSSNQP